MPPIPQLPPSYKSPVVANGEHHSLRLGKIQREQPRPGEEHHTDLPGGRGDRSMSWGVGVDGAIGDVPAVHRSAIGTATARECGNLRDVLLGGSHHDNGRRFWIKKVEIVRPCLIRWNTYEGAADGAHVAEFHVFLVKRAATCARPVCRVDQQLGERVEDLWVVGAVGRPSWTRPYLVDYLALRIAVKPVLIKYYTVLWDGTASHAVGYGCHLLLPCGGLARE